jgi:uncharacterized protein
MSNIFEGLEKLGFDNLENLDLFEKQKDKVKEKSASEILSEKKMEIEQYLYDKIYECPVCESSFKERTVKNSKIRLVSTDTDLRSYYEPIDPFLYDVVLCSSCGYTAVTSFFSKKMHQKYIDLISKGITSKFKPHIYPPVFDVDIAIERYKLALLNCLIKQAKDGEKAYICLKLGWLYREKKDKKQERVYHLHALQGFTKAYENEIGPVSGINEDTLVYLIGELHRRNGDTKKALIWFGKVILSKSASARLKERARSQKELINSTSI